MSLVPAIDPMASRPVRAGRQGTLFDLPAPHEHRGTTRDGWGEGLAAHVDRDKLAEIAFVFTATERGNSSGVRFAMSIPDAMAWCDSPISSGTLHGTRWAYFWTSAANYVGMYGASVDLSSMRDSGEWDERIAAQGLTKIHLDDLPARLAPMGVVVKRLAK